MIKCFWKDGKIHLKDSKCDRRIGHENKNEATSYFYKHRVITKMGKKDWYKDLCAVCALREICEWEE